MMRVGYLCSMPLKGGTDHGRRSVLVDFIGLVQHLGRDLTGFGGPLSQWNAFWLSKWLPALFLRPSSGHM